MNKYRYTYKPKSRDVASFLIWLAMICFGIITVIMFINALGRSFDRSYERRCVVWQDCDSTAIEHYQAQGCEILGRVMPDGSVKKWAECK